MHFLARDSFDRGGIALERFHAVLQFPVFLVELADFLADFRGLLLCAAHRQDAVRPENILEQQQNESAGEEPVEIAAEKPAHMLDECLPAIHLSLIHCLLTHVRASSASFCDAAGEADSA